MGLLDYYRQFDDIDQEEVNRALRARRARERALALAEVPVVDLSSTEWPDFPHSEIMNAAKNESRELLAKSHADSTRELQEAEAKGDRLLEQSRHQAIELTNTTDQAIDVSGWFLSDDLNNLAKYRLALDDRGRLHLELPVTGDLRLVERRPAVDRVAEHVHNATEQRVADGDREDAPRELDRVAFFDLL